MSFPPLLSLVIIQTQKVSNSSLITLPQPGNPKVATHSLNVIYSALMNDLVVINKADMF